MMMWLSNEDEVLQDCKEDQREVMVVWRFPLCFSRKIGSNDESFYIPAVFLCGMQIMDTCLMTCQIIGIIVLMGQDENLLWNCYRFFLQLIINLQPLLW